MTYLVEFQKEFCTSSIEVCASSPFTALLSAYRRVLPGCTAPGVKPDRIKKVNKVFGPFERKALRP